MRWALAALVTAVLSITALAQPGVGARDYSRGLDALAAAKWADAISALDAAINADPDSGELHLARGVARTLAEDFPGAKTDLERARKLRNDDWECKLWLAAAHFMSNDARTASSLLSWGPPEARPYADLVHRTARAYMESRYTGGYFDMEQRKRIATTAPVRTGFSATAKAFVARHRAGGAATTATLEDAKRAMEERRFADAMTLATLLRKDKPEDRAIRTLYARAALESGDALAARSEATALLTEDPFDAEMYIVRARAAHAMGDQARASRDVETARSLGAAGSIPEILTKPLSPPIPSARDLEIARMMLANHAVQGTLATIDVREAAERLVRGFENHRRRAGEEYQDGLRDRLLAVRDRPSADTHAELGAFLYNGAAMRRGEMVEPRTEYLWYRPTTKEDRAEEFARAEAAIDSALKLNPDHPRALAFKAGCLMRRLRGDEAEAAVKKALALGPQSPELLVMLADILDHAASVKAGRATSLRSVETWTDATHIYWRRPSQNELDRADEFDAQAERLWKLAEQNLRAAAAKASGTALGAYYEGVIARRTGDASAARAAFEKAVQLDGNLVAARDQLTAIYASAGMREQAARQQAAAANTVHTTAGPLLRFAWDEIVRTARSAARKAVEDAWALDSADPRCAAYLGIIAADSDKPQEAAGWFRVSLALLEARSRQRGQTLAPDGKGSIHDEDLGLALAICERAARIGAPEGALAAALRARITDEVLYTPLPGSMLPDPTLDSTKVPELRTAAYFIASANVGIGQEALKKGDLDAADRAFAEAKRIENLWPITQLGREQMYVPGAAARVGQIRVELARGRPAEARAIMNREGWPGDLPQALKDEIAELKKQLQRAK